MHEPTPIERAIFEFWDLQVTSGTPDAAFACYMTRDVTGCGFFLEPAPGQLRLPLKPTAKLEDINGIDESGMPLIEIIPFQDDLGIKMIEAFCYTSLWPECEFIDLSLGESKVEHRTKNIVGPPGIVSLRTLAKKGFVP